MRMMLLLALLSALAPSAGTAVAQTESAAAGPDKTYLLSLPDGAQAVQVTVVPRAKINRDLSVDMIGLRLWMDSAQSVRRIWALIAAPAAALRVKQQLGARIMETGVEPDMIPVRGEEGKKAGTEGMTLLEGGEFTRTGEYYDSGGGGLTIR